MFQFCYQGSSKCINPPNILPTQPDSREQLVNFSVSFSERQVDVAKTQACEVSRIPQYGSAQKNWPSATMPRCFLLRTSFPGFWRALRERRPVIQKLFAAHCRQ